MELRSGEKGDKIINFFQTNRKDAAISSQTSRKDAIYETEAFSECNET